MRKIVKSFVIIMLLSVVLIGVVQAKSIQLNSINLSLEMPDEYEILLEEGNLNDEIIEKNEIDKDFIIAYMTEQNIVFDAVTNGIEKEICVVVLENSSFEEIYSLTKLSNARIEGEFADEFRKLFPIVRIQEVNGIKYLYVENSTETYIMQQYFTIINGKAVYIKLAYYTAQTQEGEIEGIMNTVKFDIIEQPKEKYVLEIYDYFIIIGLSMATVGFIMMIFSSKRVYKKDAKTIKIIEFFKERNAVDPNNAIKRKEIPFRIRKGNRFEMMRYHGMIVKMEGWKYYYNEEALEKELTKAKGKAAARIFILVLISALVGGVIGVIIGFLDI